MSTFNSSHFPRELLNLIFQYLSPRDLYQCQKVCRTWYLPAHENFLSQVTLFNSAHVDNFLNCLLNDSKSARLVKKITFNDDNNWLKGQILTLDKTKLEQIVLTFPRLESLTIGDLWLILDTLNDDTLLQLINEHCLNLKSITASYWTLDHFGSANKHIQILYHLRNKLTKLKLTLKKKQHSGLESLQDLQNFFASFPLLQKLCAHRMENIQKFSDCLPIFEVTPNLTSLKIYIKATDEPNFMNQYLQYYKNSSSSSSSSVALERMRVIKKLRIIERTMSLSNLKFITEYFTGLKQLKITYVVLTFAKSQNLTLFYDFLSFLCARDTFSIRNISLSIEYGLFPCLKSITRHMYQKNTIRHMKIELNFDSHRIEPSWYIDGSMTLESKRTLGNRLVRSIRLKLFCRVGFIHIMRSLSKPIFNTLKEVDILELNAQGVTQLLQLNFIALFHDFLHFTGDSLYKIILSIPNNFKWDPYFTNPEYTCEYPQITHLEINVDCCNGRTAVMHKMLCFIDLFPNLKSLRLMYYSGAYDAIDFSFSIGLPLTCLESLHLDLTPLIFKVLQLDENNKTLMILLEIEIGYKVFYYIVSLASLRITRIEQDIVAIMMYFGVKLHIVLQDIQHLYLYVSSRGYDRHYAMHPQNMIENKISFI